MRDRTLQQPFCHIAEVVKKKKAAPNFFPLRRLQNHATSPYALRRFGREGKDSVEVSRTKFV